MKRAHILAIAAIVSLATTPAMAAKTYQVTGPVVEVSGNTVTVQKGKEKWEIEKGAAEFPATLKTGDKVTIEYSMTATKVAAKPATPAAKKPAK